MLFLRHNIYKTKSERKVIMKTIKRRVMCVLSLSLVVLMLFNMSSCVKIKAVDLMEDIKENTVTGKTPDDTFNASTADFAVELFKSSIINNENSLISPLSMMLALAMTANGADNETKAEMEKVLGGDLTIEELNKYLYSYVKGLPSEKKYNVNIANSIWYNENQDSYFERDFLQTNKDYYDASVYMSPFDAQTVKDINNWVEDKTKGMIDEIVKQINSNTVMYLINALSFEAEWEEKYEKKNVYDGEFTSVKGEKQNVEMMRSEEVKYIKNDKASGFIKDYKDGKYSFVAILPNSDISINEYISSLTGDSLMETIKGAKNTGVTTVMPKFSYDYSFVMNEALINMGMGTAFDRDKANFSKMGSGMDGNLYIGEVIHKTFITVDESGTKAGAVTKVEMRDKSVTANTVILDRPFVYAIIDNTTNLPLFIGTVVDLS